ncbi:uncharacterized protein BHQ10_007990 [Talaromyces amestolkiae]|uniref:Uncharacterized protein n=1 Tax=Talaromyces amestolkiae TaxID=1196081 RepID=A0A364L834_TALAM|nr:uncharacterized protein BHQ10_007990 [Talaromyces amestolkiae]RAO71978.1 hypothetical protein BHQ10_007990 [Talaromyces amestolkiae]
MLTAAILLSSYEAIAASRSSHKSHYKGALNLILTRGISARSIGLDRANFFVYLRHEITIALNDGLPLQFDPLSWNIAKPGAGASEDNIANYLMLLIGQIVNVIHSGEDSLLERRTLERQIDEWYSAVSQEFRGISYGKAVEGRPQKIFFPIPATAAAMIWFYTARILLSAKEMASDRSYGLLIEQSSKSIIQIASSVLPASVRCFAITPIYIAGKYTNDISSRIRCCLLLDAIEREIGYRTQDKIKSLEAMIR